MTSGTAEADAAKELKANVETFSEAQRRWSALLKESVKAKKAVGTAEESGNVKFSMRQNITGDSGKVYGDGVYLDSNLLDGLSDKERVQMVKARIAELGGQTFTAYDGNTPVEIKIENSRKRFKNKNDRFVQVNKDLTVKHIGQKIKQEAVVLSDEIIKASKFKESIPSKYSHGWLDNNGQSNWERRTVFVQEKNNSVWEATLHIANAQNGEKVLYDIDPIKKVESPIKLGATSTTDSIRQGEENVNTQFSMRVDSEGRELSEAQQEYFEYSEVRNKEGLLIPVYHATDNSFTVFDRKKLGAETDENADDVAFAATAHIGFWFNSNDIKGKTAQNKSLAGYLNIEEPYYVDSIGALAAQIMDNYGENYDELQERFESRDYKAARELGEGFADWLKQEGYDGVIVNDEEFGGTSYVALKSNQFKNADNQNPTENPDIRYSKRGNFTEDKYYSRQIDNLENLKEGSYITVGEIKKDSPLNLVGIPDKRLYFDVSKIRQEMKDRSDPIPSEKIKDIPKVLDNPIVITEYVDKHATHSVNVYGKLYIGSSPVVIGVMIAKTPKGNLVNKVQTVHPNRNFANEMTADKILYLTPNKKETRQWFQSLSAQMPLLRGNKSGFIRSIAQEGNEVKPSVSDLGKIQYQLRIEDKNRLDILDRQEERYAADLKTLERAYAEAVRAEYERNIKPGEETSKRAAAAHRCKTVKIVL